MSISGRITRAFIDEGIIGQDDYVVYEYCINAVLDIFGNILVTMVLGLILNRLWETLIFLAVVIPLRSFAGGYHAKTSMGCLMLSVLYYLVSIYMPVYCIQMENGKIHILYALSAVIVFVMAPTASVNKPLSKEQERQMHRLTGYMIFFITILYIFFQVYMKKIYAVELCVILIILFLSQISEKMKNLHSC